MAAVAEVVAEAAVVGAETQLRDRVGIGWRADLAAGIFANLDCIGAVEVIAEDYSRTGKTAMRALRRLREHVPVTLHGVTMGLASTIPVARERVERMAHLVAAIEPESWSEHLAFVRAGAVEIGHLAAPPRTLQSVAGTIANIETATRIIGTPPILENIATLIDPPASTLCEAQWVAQIVRGSGTHLLLDLHNLYANACNFGRDPTELLLAFPLERVALVHISGGRWVDIPGGKPGQKRLLDDHLHDVPPAVHDLLTVLAGRVAQPLTVILERDGHFPKFDHLLEQLALARSAMQRGRALALNERVCA